MDNNLDNKEKSSKFDTTHWSLILKKERRKECLKELCGSYWTPIYLYARKLGCSKEDAEELTQNLFVEMLETDLLDRANPDRGKFRTYLIGVLKNLHNEDLRHKYARKRNPGPGKIRHLGPYLDQEKEERYLEAPDDTECDIFNKEWAYITIHKAIEKLRTYCHKNLDKDKQMALKAFELHFFEDQKPAKIAEILGYDAKWVSEKIYRLKLKYSEFLYSVVGETLSEGESVEEEIMDLRKYTQIKQ